MYLDATIAQLPSQWQVLERDLVTVGRYEAGRVVTQFSFRGVTGKQLMYFIKVDKTMWLVNFSTGASEYEQRLANFEQAIETLIILP